MWSSTSTSSDLAKGKKFLEKLQYVQHVDKKKAMISEISEPILQNLLANRKVCQDSNSTENVGNPKANLDILKSSLGDRIFFVMVCSNPLQISLVSSPTVTFHAFVVFATCNNANSRKQMWWSLEKNGNYIVLQQSTNQDDVYGKKYDTEKKTSVERHGEVKIKKYALGNDATLKYLLQVIWETNQIIDPYHLLYSNCQNFASFIFEKLNGEREKWSTYLGAVFGRLRGRKKKAAIEVNTVMYKSIVKDDKFVYCKTMMDGRKEDFEELINNLTIEFLNSVDSQGYTLLEWATVFSTSHWPIAEELKKKGAQIPSDERLFRRNVFFIALQYLPTKSKLFDSFDGIDIHGVNKTGETALHLALYGEKWQIAEEILRKFKNFDVNSTNVLRNTPLHLAAKLKNCKIGLFKKILHRTNSENVNKTDGNGWTALHSAIDKESATKVEELLSHKDVDVTIKNKDNNSTTLHLASKWPKIPADLFQMIFKKSTDLINAHNEDGNTALHFAIMTKFDSAAKKLLAHKDVNVDAKNNEKILALHRACICKNIPMDLFKLVLDKSTDVNAQDIHGHTALHYAILHQSKTHVEELLKHKDVNVNVKNVKNQTALHCASMRKDMPMDLFKFILEKTVDINVQDKDGNTALHWAIAQKFDTKVKELLAHSDVDVNIKGEFYYTPLHLTCGWPNIPADLFQIILDKSTSDTIDAQTKNGHTALHLAFLTSLEEADKKQQQYCCC